MSGSRTSHDALIQLRESLSARDMAILQEVRDLRLMRGGQIQAVFFPLSDHATIDAAGRACRRVVRRLTKLGLLAELERRIGGMRGGSSGAVYGVGSLGHRLLNQGQPQRRFREPSGTFVHHTLAVAQVVVDLIGRQRAKQLDILRLETEPRCWRTFGAGGGREIVRPDLFVALGVGEYEHHSWVEIDMGTETMRRRVTKCRLYQALYQSGTEQATHDLFPKVVWCLPNETLAAQLMHQIKNTRSLTAELFVATTPERLIAALAGGSL